MGIDPGTNRMGYGLLEVRGNVLKCEVMGDIELTKLKDPYLKLKHIFERVSALIDIYQPDEVALESPFFGENVQSMLKLGRAQGVAMAAALHKDVPVFEYAPRRIKQAITGRGAATKEQVAVMLKSMLGVEYDLRRLDATDGLSVALCHYFATSSLIGALDLKNSSAAFKKNKKRDSWESFVARNPQRRIKNEK